MSLTRSGASAIVLLALALLAGRGGHLPRRLLALLALSLVMMLSIVSVAAAYSGTSLDDNVSPATEVHGLADHWPSNRYGLDHHVGDIITTGKPKVPLGGKPLDLIAPGSGDIANSLLGKVPINVPTGVDTDAASADTKHTLAEAIWDGVRWGIGLLVTLLTFALSLDFLSGPKSLLGPVAHSVTRLYHELSSGWMASAVIGLGLYVLVFAVLRRKITQTFGKVIVSFLMVSFALLLMTQWQWTIGATSKYTNDASLAIIATVNGDATRDAKVAATDALWDTLVIQPFMVLNFGGLEHCVDKDGNSVKPKSTECDTKINNRKYLKRWLDAGPPNSPGRQLEYEAIRDAKIPDASKIRAAGMPANSFDGYKLSAADTPAVDVQQREIAGDRLIVACLIAVGAIGAALTIGGAAIAIIVFKILAIFLFGFTAIIGVLALFPGAGHRAFWSWFERLALALTFGVWYSLVLSLVLAISRGLAATAPELGWKLTYVLLAIFWWAVFLLRKHALRLILRSLPGARGEHDGDRSFGDHAQGWYYKSKMLLPAAAGVGAGVGAVVHGTGRTGANAVDGMRMVKEKADDYAAKGHSERQRETADLHGRALTELEGEHERNVRHHREEQQRRARREELAARRRAAASSTIPDDVLQSMDLPSNALSPAEAKELNHLESTAIPKEDFQALGATVNDVERRRQDTDGQPFSLEQINARAAQIQEREDARQDLAKRAKHYAEWEYDDLFGADDDLLGPHPRAEGAKLREREARQRQRRRQQRRRSHQRDGE